MDFPFIGQIQLFALGFAPVDWQLCNGAVFQIAGNEALYSLIGNKFGGTPGQNFAVPNLLKASAYQIKRPMAYYISMNGMYPQPS
ncbi:phage tail protein [Ruminiclostridium cellulolyticum]|uniref:Tail Collar domain protein n=1 Tax=Ruminiclostridium cellulolyticum (strain ATCC 35319 / DSM 5812 / JCM 6584 / H10) TaxID=394503 RepID=B8I655_RUMCH|nr:phage tail protein [Ruminiclostridium cellulolyticum]ACL76820.1 Tail Collar domain protein [Ruminiclostridium cellulolyticum H10]